MRDPALVEVLEHLDAALEKQAAIQHQIGAGLRGFVQGARQTAQSQKGRAAFQKATDVLHSSGSLPLNTVNGVLQPLPQGVSVGERGPGLFARAKGQLQGALAGAKQQFTQTRAADKAVKNFRQVQQGEQTLHNAAQVARQNGMQVDPLQGQLNYSQMTPQQYLQLHGHTVPAHHATPGAKQVPLPRHDAATSAPQDAPAPQSFLSRHAVPLTMAAGGLAVGASMLRGAPNAAEQDARMRDYMTNAQTNMATPLPPMAVYASYDEFAAAKTAAYAPVYPAMQGAMANALSNQLAMKFVGEPIDAIQRVLKKKLYDEPKHRSTFHQAIEGDDMLQAAHAENPRGLEDTFSTLKAFAPSIAMNPHATRTFLRQATMSGLHGTGPDFATIRLMTETEKFIQNAKGRGSQ